MFQVFFGAVALRVEGEGGVAYFAHTGGFALGAVAMLALQATHRRVDRYRPSFSLGKVSSPCPCASSNSR